MGIVDKRFCDWCGVEIEIVQHRLALTESTSIPVTTASLDICGGCYTKWQTYLLRRRDEVIAAWKIDPAVLVPKELK